MRYSCKTSVEYDLELHHKLKEKYIAELTLRSDYKNVLLKKSNSHKGTTYYRVKYPGDNDYSYISREKQQEIDCIREFAFYSKALEVVERNIEAMESFLGIYRRTNAENINELLKGVYTLPPSSKVLTDCAEAERWLAQRNKEKSSYPVFDPEGLTVTAFDGTKVRSRAEAMHYEGFYIYGIPAVFEYPFTINGEVYHPDFTVLDTFIMMDKILEHLGNWYHDNAFKRDHYRTDAYHRWDEYGTIGFYPEHNLLLTFPLLNNKLDMQSICRKIAMLASPPPDPDTIDLLRHL